MSGQSQLKNYLDCGVYAITHIESGKIYVGSAVNIPRRKRSHFRELRRNQHDNTYLQAAYNKYGETAFTFKIVIVCPPEDRIFHEQRIMDDHQSYNKERGYNFSKIAGVTVPTPEMRAKMSASAKGRVPWNKGIECSEETKRKISESNMGKVAPNKGIPCSEETKEKLSLQRMGKKLPDEWKKNISESLKGKNTWSRGRKLSPEHIEKLVLTRKSKTHCRKGHEFNEENTSIEGNTRRCITCRQNAVIKRFQKGETP